MQQNVAVAKQKLIARLQEDYGSEHYERMFVVPNEKDGGESVGRHLFGSAESATWQQAQRKLMKKLLMHVSLTSPSTNRTMIPFVWATGGNSVAAGHGGSVYRRFWNGKFRVRFGRQGFTLSVAITP